MFWRESARWWRSAGDQATLDATPVTVVVSLVTAAGVRTVDALVSNGSAAVISGAAVAIHLRTGLASLVGLGVAIVAGVVDVVAAEVRVGVVDSCLVIYGATDGAGHLTVTLTAVENVRGAKPFLRPLLGEPVAHVGRSFYVWGQLPPLPEFRPGHLKQARSSSNVRARGSYPADFCEMVADAVDREVRLLGGQSGGEA